MPFSSNCLIIAIRSGREHRCDAGLSTMEQQWIATKINSYLLHLPGQPAPQLPPPPSESASRYRPVCTCCCLFKAGCRAHSPAARGHVSGFATVLSTLLICKSICAERSCGRRYLHCAELPIFEE